MAFHYGEDTNVNSVPYWLRKTTNVNPALLWAEFSCVSSVAGLSVEL